MFASSCSWLVTVCLWFVGITWWSVHDDVSQAAHSWTAMLTWGGCSGWSRSSWKISDLLFSMSKGCWRSVHWRWCVALGVPCAVWTLRLVVVGNLCSPGCSELSVWIWFTWLLVVHEQVLVCSAVRDLQTCILVNIEALHQSQDRDCGLLLWGLVALSLELHDVRY